MARRNLYGGLWKTMLVVLELINDMALRLNTEAATEGADQVLSNDGAGTAGRTGVDIAVDANANDIQFDNAVFFQIAGQKYYSALIGAIDLSDLATANTDTVTADGDGAFWVYLNTAGVVDAESNQTAQNFASPVEALAQYSIATNTLPPGSDDVCVGCIGITEVAGGGFIFGADSLTAETEIYYSFEGLPGIESEMASFALDAAAATVTYGAATFVLGTGVRVVATGKANVAFNSATVVAVGKTGAYLLYALADDVDILVTATSTANDLQAAKDLVRDLVPNPLMPLLGVVYVTARLNAFTPGTTLLDLNGIDTEFVTYGVGSNRQEHGRASGSTFTAIDEVLHNAAPAGQARRP